MSDEGSRTTLGSGNHARRTGHGSGLLVPTHNRGGQSNAKRIAVFADPRKTVLTKQHSVLIATDRIQYFSMHLFRCKGQFHGARRGQRTRCPQIAFWEIPQKARRYRGLWQRCFHQERRGTSWSPGLQIMSNISRSTSSLQRIKASRGRRSGTSGRGYTF